MKAIYLVQAGEHGPVRIVHSTPEAIARTQAGNCDLLTIRAVYEGDAKALRELHERYSADVIREDWFAPSILERKPTDLQPILYDYEAQGRRLQAQREADRAQNANLRAALLARTPAAA